MFHLNHGLDSKCSLLLSNPLSDVVKSAVRKLLLNRPACPAAILYHCGKVVDISAFFVGRTDSCGNSEILSAVMAIVSPWAGRDR